MIDIVDYDILKTKEVVFEDKYDEKYPRFVRAFGSSGKDDYPVGSVFLSLRRGRTVKSEFAGKTFSKVFEEIVLSPDGRIGVLEKVRRSRIA